MSEAAHGVRRNRHDTNGEPDDRLIELFAKFPFRFVEVDGSIYKLNAEEFYKEYDNLVA